MGREAIPIPPQLGLAEEVATISLTNADVAHLAIYLTFVVAVAVIITEFFKECWLNGQVRKERWEHTKFKFDAKIAKWETEKADRGATRTPGNPGAEGDPRI